MLRPEVCCVWSTYHCLDLFPVMWKDGANTPIPAPPGCSCPLTGAASWVNSEQHLIPGGGSLQKQLPEPRLVMLDGHQTSFLGVIWAPESSPKPCWVGPGCGIQGCPPWQVSPSLGSANGENAGTGGISGCGSTGLSWI